MDTIDILMWVAIGTSMLLIISIMIIILLAWDYRANNKLLKEAMKQLYSRDVDSSVTMIKYTESLIDYIRNMVSATAVIKFKEFQDAHDMKKISRERYTSVIRDVAESVKDGMKYDNIAFNNLLVTEQWLDKFIIDTTVHAVKSLLEDYTSNEGI